MSDVFDRIRDEIGKNDVLLFMKGTPVFPQCGFSAAVVDVLSQLGVKFHGVNILVDPDLRQGIKEFSQWPTIPQLYVKGEFVGGCDIIREMFETGELEQLMKEKGVTLAPAAEAAVGRARGGRRAPSRRSAEGRTAEPAVSRLADTIA
jgi:monothiol glutaredoxin